MVFLTLCNFARNVGTNRFWRVQMYKRMSWKYHSRQRNCYQLGIRVVHKALMYSNISRKLKMQNYKKLWNTRITAATMEHGMPKDLFMEGLARSHIQLDRKVLTDLAIYEPRTFQSLVEISKAKLETDGLSSPEIPKAQGIITRGML